MATQKFHIITNPSGESDGIIQLRTKENVGFAFHEIGNAYNQDAPDGTFINCSMQDHWIINEEDYKLLKQTKSCKK